MNTQSLKWLRRAADDLAVARLVLDENYAAHACFLAQQCMEKSLKAFLLYKQNRYPRTHKLVDLLNVCRQLDNRWNDFFDDCIVVDQYYIPTRYPDAIPGGLPEGLPSAAEAAESIASAERLLQFAVTLIPAQ